ncbi:putative short-chain dehydrogenase [Stachybotrys elegans]|uniref:Short-chain dehydrogenase n=1 Tax=Stachybotrys elegans TaxID=80388 RepID=A0A8K0WPL2_9HYPO|nr:putative short-chain dehydrogenase [Stachybotrys elegans]
MSAPFPTLAITKTWHNTSYPAISPTRKELSAAGKTVVVTGGGTGIGASMARAFAAAGSTQIALFGRREKPLQDTAKELESNFPGLQVLTYSVDVTVKAQVDTAFDFVHSKFGPIDVLMSNAGYVPTGLDPISKLDVEDVWTAFEINVKGSLHVAQAFSRTSRESGAVVVDTSSVVAVLPPWPGAVGYTSSKLASAKVWEFYSAENPETRVVSIQPGTVATDMAEKVGVKGPFDDADLASHFSVWLASPEAHFLDGKYVISNWDVEELKAQADKFAKTDFGSIRLTV